MGEKKRQRQVSPEKLLDIMVFSGNGEENRGLEMRRGEEKRGGVERTALFAACNLTICSHKRALGLWSKQERRHFRFLLPRET